MDLHAVDEVLRERGLQYLAHFGMVVAEAREALAGVEVEVRATVGVVEIRAARGHVVLVKAEDAEHVDERRVEMARCQLQVLVSARESVRYHAKRVQTVHRTRWSLPGPHRTCTSLARVRAMTIGRQLAARRLAWDNKVGVICVAVCAARPIPRGTRDAVLRGVAITALVTALLVSAARPIPASAAAPFGFIGVNAEDVYAGDAAYQQRMLSEMEANGVTEVRQLWRWRYSEPQKGVFDWSRLDRLVLAATEHHIRILPLLTEGPPWASSQPPGNTQRCFFPPRNDADYADWVGHVVERYGRGGLLWQVHPELARWELTAYEIWNEPNKPTFWACHPNARAFVRLARAAAEAIRARDPRATIISAGMPKVHKPETYLRQMFKAGALHVFNALGLHPYARSPAQVLGDIRAARRLIDKHRAKRWPIYVTEFGWATGGPRSSYTVTSERQQARLIKKTYLDLARRRKALKIVSVDYYDWHDLPPPIDLGVPKDYWGLHTGFLRINSTVKPALKAVRQASREIK